jgi:hypothetical protein
MQLHVELQFALLPSVQCLLACQRLHRKHRQLLQLSHAHCLPAARLLLLLLLPACLPVP